MAANDPNPFLEMLNKKRGASGGAPAPGGQSGGSPKGGGFPFGNKGKSKKNAGKQAAIGRRLAAMKK